MDTERRYFPVERMETIETEDGKLFIEGYPIVYDEYANLWGFRETIKPGAATGALKKSKEVVLWNHNSDKPMASRNNGTLKVKEDDRGVHIRADVSGTVWGREGYESIKNGVTEKMSFAFSLSPDGQKWRVDEIEGVKIETREIIEFDEIYDYSPVTYPAYEQTEVVARSKEIALRQRPDFGAPESDDLEASKACKASRKRKLQIQENNYWRKKKNEDELSNASKEA